jgi:hypothetical protein
MQQRNRKCRRYHDCKAIVELMKPVPAVVEVDICIPADRLAITLHNLANGTVVAPPGLVTVLGCQAALLPQSLSQCGECRLSITEIVCSLVGIMLLFINRSLEDRCLTNKCPLRRSGQLRSTHFYTSFCALCVLSRRFILTLSTLHLESPGRKRESAEAPRSDA